MLDYQRQLIIAGLDDFTPNATLANFCGGQYGLEKDRWKSAVIEFICINFHCGLIELTHRPDMSRARDTKALKNLLILGDIENDVDTNILWDSLYFNGTQYLVDVLIKSNLYGWEFLRDDVNERLTDFLKEIYDKYELHLKDL